jgi:hypothetical protein
LAVKRSSTELDVMKLVMYRRWQDRVASNLQVMIREGLPQLRIEAFSTTETLLLGLRNPDAVPILAVVLVPTTAADLEQIVQARILLEDIRTLLVLPSHDAAMVALGHRLRPSFIAFHDGDVSEVGAVLDKIMSRRLAETTGLRA